MFNDQETLDTLLAQVRERVFNDYGLELLEMRDLHTGAPIGSIHEDVFHTALIDEGVLDDSEDGETIAIEDLADTMLVRSLASARPSPALNRPTSQSLRRLLDSQPVVVCAYLLNRYKLSDWRKLNHRDDSWFDDILHRVKVWEKLERFANDPDTDRSESVLRAFTHWLLELDSKCNLHSLTPLPGWFEAFLGLTDLDQLDLFTRDFAIIASPKIIEADKAMTIGNRMASGAFVKSWFDNPVLAQRKVEIANAKRQRLYDKYGDTKVGAILEAYESEARQARQAEKSKKDARIIKGRSSRSKSAKLVNKHSDVLAKLWRTMAEVTDADGIRANPKPDKPAVRPTGLPKFVKG